MQMIPEGKFDRCGRTFEIAKQPDGVWWLLLWLAPGSSVRIGVHAMAETALYQAENLPPDFNVRDAMRSPVASFAFAEGLAHPREG